MTKSSQYIENLQSLTSEELVSWLEQNNLTEHAFAKLVGQTPRNISRMVTRAIPIPVSVALITGLVDKLSNREREKMLKFLREYAPQKRNFYNRKS